MYFRRIGDLRIDHDVKQTEIASYLNVSQTTYSWYETGKLDIPTSALILLAKFYHVSIDYLLGVE